MLLSQVWLQQMCSNLATLMAAAASFLTSLVRWFVGAFLATIFTFRFRPPDSDVHVHVEEKKIKENEDEEGERKPLGKLQPKNVFFDLEKFGCEAGQVSVIY